MARVLGFLPETMLGLHKVLVTTVGEGVSVRVIEIVVPNDGVVSGF